MLNLTPPLLTALAVANALLIVNQASRRIQLTIGTGLVVLAGLLLKDWVEGLAYLIFMP